MTYENRFKMMKLLQRSSSRSSSGIKMSDGALSLNGSANGLSGSVDRLSMNNSTQNIQESTLTESGINLNDFGSSLSDSGGSQIDTGRVHFSSSTVNQPEEVAVCFYTEELDGDGLKEHRFSETATCEDICLSLALKVNITPALLNCFGLGQYDVALKKFFWLAPRQRPGDVRGPYFQAQPKDIHFRMRFLPDPTKFVQLDETDANCLSYLMWQVKWDFVHSSLSCFFEASKTDEARGFSCMLILLALRMSTEDKPCQENVKTFMKKRNLDNFLPFALRRKLIEKKILEDSMIKKVRDLQESHPADRYTSQYLKKWCLQVSLKQNQGYYTENFEAYDLDIDNEEFERIDEEDVHNQVVEQKELTITVKMEQSFPTLTVAKKNATYKHHYILSCYVDSIAKLVITEIELDGNKWWKLQLFRQDGHPEMLYFKDKRETYSFATCVESYYRLIYDFYDSLCQEVEPSCVREQNTIRAHGPVRDEFVRKKLKKKNSKDLYVLRMSLRQYKQYDILYLPSATEKLRIETLPKIQHVEGGYIVAGSQDPPQDLKMLVSDLIKDFRLVPSTCMRIKPQSEGCDILQSLLMGQEPRDPQEEDEERRERRKIENQPKVYCMADLEKQSLLGQGHFTEVYNGLLLGQEEVAVKQLRIPEIQDDFFKIVQESFNEGLEKLMTLGDPNFFVGYLGMCLVPNLCMVMKGTRYGSLQHFLQIREQGLPMLSLHHLLDANIQLASSLVYMEERNCYHGNLNCSNVCVTVYDNRTMVVRLCDPGLITLYNKLPLQHPVNEKRLPWIAPELYSDLTAITAQTEVFAYGTTLWQLFSHGLNPINNDVKLKNKTMAQIREFFSTGQGLSCPVLLKVKNDDPPEIKEIKELLFSVMRSCWNRDPQERDNPKLILKKLNSNAQSYEETYHKYNIIPYFDVSASAASYPLTSSSEGTRIHSSGFINSEEPVLVPDLTCLKADSRRPVELSQRDNQSVTRQPLEQDQSTLSFDHTSPGATGAGRTHDPQELSRLQLQSQFRGVFMPPRPSVASPISPPTACYTIMESRLQIDHNNELGKGHYGAVYKGKLYPTDAMKVLDPNVEPETIVVKVLKEEMVSKYSEDFKKEAQLMMGLSHPNVVKFYGTSCQGRYLVMEFVENNSLHKYICGKRSTQNIKLQTFLQLSVDIASGMDYLEMERVIHCDLAARNILLTGTLCAKISDFGLSKILSQEKDYYRRTTEKTIPLWWCAPEWIGYKRFTSKSDVWSFGVVLWEMFSYGKPPFIKNNTNPRFFHDLLLKNERLKQPSNCPDNVYTEMLNCWKINPSDRPDFKTLRERFKLLCENNAAVETSSINQGAWVQSTTSPVSRTGHSVAGNNTSKDSPSRHTDSKNFFSPEKTTVGTEKNDTVTDSHKEETSKKEPVATEPSSIGNRFPEQRSEQKEISQPSFLAGGDETCIQNDQPSAKTDESSRLNNIICGESHAAAQKVNPGEVTNQNGLLEDEGLQSCQTKLSSTGMQQLSGKEQLSGKDSKIGGEDIIIQKKDLIINRSNLLGKGAFGAVYKGTYRGENVAVKECTDAKQYDRFSREFHLLYKLKQKSTNIVQFVGLYEKQNSGVRKEHMYVMEYMGRGSLSSYLDKQKKAGIPVHLHEKLHFLVDIAKGMDYLFKASIIHCDLTAKNVLLSADLTAKISDFGWAKELESTEDNVQYRRNSVTFQPFWAAPEVFEQEMYTKFSDIWSYGVVCMEVFLDAGTPYLDLPSHTQTINGEEYYKKFYRAILGGKRFPRPAQCPEKIYNSVILKCWERNHKERIVYSRIIQEFTSYTSQG